MDCYNVLRATMPPVLAGLDEAGLCRALSRLARDGAVKGPMTVVCDGVVKPLGLTRSPVDEVELIYSGKKKSADDVIIEMIEADTAPRRLLVVSSDREIMKAARRRKATAVSAAEFIRMLAAPRAKGGASGKRTGVLDEAEVERWLHEFGVNDEKQ